MSAIDNDLPSTVVQVVGNWSEEMAALIAALTRKHRLQVAVLMVMKVLEKVGEFDDDAETVVG